MGMEVDGVCRWLCMRNDRLLYRVKNRRRCAVPFDSDYFSQPRTANLAIHSGIITE